MAKTAYISDGPTLDGAVKVSGNGPGQASSSQTAMPTGAVTGSSASGQSQLEDATTGSMPVVNTLTVETNQDGTIGIKTSVADAMPETGPGASSRNSSTSASTGSVSSVGVQTGWVQVGNGYKYYKEDGSGYKTGWHYEYNADGSKIWYYFDEKPDTKEWMATGWRRIVNGAGVLCWYHFRVDGKMSRYWECLDGWWYYFEPRDDAGYLVSDWYILNNEYYYFNTDDDKGYMQIDWLKIRGKWYYFHKTDEKKGIMAANHMVNHTDGNKYYLGSDGAMVVSITFKSVEDGKTYKADENGICIELVAENDFVDIPQDGELGTTISYMGWHKIKSKSSNQYKLRESAKSAGRASIANPEYYAMIDGRILIATKQDIGRKLHLEIGDYVDVLFKKQDGSIWTYECILGDFKGDDAPNIWGHYDGKGVVEIIYWDYSPPAGYNKNINNPWGKGRVIRVTKKGDYYS